jgi:flagellar biosynthesis/type III secretory pathway protein FliH
LDAGRPGRRPQRSKQGRDEGRKEGRDEGRAEELERQLRTFAEMHATDELPDSAYRRLKDLAEQELRREL